MGVPLPGVETGIAVSAIALGGMVAGGDHRHPRRGWCHRTGRLQLPVPRMVTTRRMALALALLLLGPQAQAHGSVKGLGDFMGGFLHPLFEPAHLVALIALLLLIAQRGVQASTAIMVALASTTATGLAAAAMGWPASTDTALLVVASLTGVVVVLARPLPQAMVVVVVLAASIGLGIGLGSDPEGLRGASRYADLAGTWFGTCLRAVSGATLIDEFKRPWIPVLIRVVGSRMVATSVLVLALHTVAPPASAPSIATSSSLSR